MVEITVQLDDAAAAALEQIAKTTSKSSNEIVVDLLMEAAKPKRALPKGFGEFHSGQPDLPEKTREILFQDAKEGRWR